jgi:VWFA-related protein
MPILKLGAFVILLSCAVVVVSQEPSQPTNSSSPVVSTLLISARAKDRPVVLTAADLEIKEDGKPVQIQQVLKTDLPIRYCVLFDVSGSEHDQFKRQQNTAIHVLRQVIRPKTDLGWFSLFSADSIEGEETDNPDDSINAIAASRAYGPTALYDTIAQCAARMERRPRDMRLRVMFLFTDGDDNQSHITLDRAINIAMGAGIRIYALRSEDFSRRRGPSILKKLADYTGGEFFSLTGAEDIKKAAVEIEEDLGNIFDVSYETQAQSGGQRKIDVKCLKKGTTLHAPKIVNFMRP